MPLYVCVIGAPALSTLLLSACIPSIIVIFELITLFISCSLLDANDTEYIHLFHYYSQVMRIRTAYAILPRNIPAFCVRFSSCIWNGSDHNVTYVFI